MASISVPIEKGYGSPYPGDHYGRPGNNYSRHPGVGGGQGPPYIVKLLNLPITADDGFVEDLFRSRYTQFVKFKIVADPSSNILETHVIKKVAFVELHSAADLAKALKWQDLYYKGNRRVVIELADFGDFQHCINFNKEHEQDIARIQEDFLAGRHRDGAFGPRGSTSRSPVRGNPPLNSTRPTPAFDNAPPLVPPGPPKPKFNPFGAAKPVDVLSKEKEIEKKLINLNKTTVQTLGPDGEAVDVQSTIKHFHEAASPKLRRNSINNSRRSSTEGRRPSVSILKRPSISNTAPQQDITESTKHRDTKKTPLSATQQSGSASNSHPATATNQPANAVATPPPQNVYDTNGKSLAELLSGKNTSISEIRGRNSSRSQKSSPKPVVSKPVILKKKVPVTSSLNTGSSSQISEDKDKATIIEVSSLNPDDVAQSDQIVKQLDLVNKEEPIQNDPITTKVDVESSIEPVRQSVNQLQLLNQNLGPYKADAVSSQENQRDEVKGTGVPQDSKIAPVRPIEDDRPDFRKHLSELVNKKVYLDKEKRLNRNNRHDKYHGHDNGEVENQRLSSEDGRPRNRGFNNGHGHRYRNRSPKTYSSRGGRYARSEEHNEADSKPNNDGQKNGDPTETRRNKKKDTDSSGASKSSSVDPSAEGKGDIQNGSASETNGSSELHNQQVPHSTANNEVTQQARGDTEKNSDVSGKPENGQVNLESEAKGGRPRGRGRGRGSSRGSSFSRGRSGFRGRGSHGHNLQYVRPKPTEEFKAEPN
ncbi:uncharacterized protein CANTADRAFT_267497 [Suhomyces tanzawaensis NRRL Y-17324]|uniref:RRM domain-containing protein n=1 Tax=Suhomyces tanzawaensis NRRL Y-17324 TaxID=984487 RepID=A0A1E4SG38_9ASCO|nr:uncharacterized protein CANTADRAFT_267497 [Suhomyces tanzawaensis NRRL Y-17324]ODV78479.1 hypothetical protein CANTADRAFT_267497 [Suhomyces tanzawaensis NRRL Y-17324]